jgi:hypothetical protein
VNRPRYVRAIPVVERLLEVFDRRELALAHLCDHVLTRPEAHDWAMLLPGYWNLVNPGNDLALLACARSFWQASPSSTAQTFYDLYCDAIQEAVTDAIRLKWYWEEQHPGDRRWCALGLSGAYVVWDERVIRTAMLLPNAELLSKGPPEDRALSPLPRRNSLRPVSSPSPPPYTPAECYHLFEDSFYCVRTEYERACSDRQVRCLGGLAFSQRPPRRSEWEQLIASRSDPAQSPAEGPS